MFEDKLKANVDMIDVSEKPKNEEELYLEEVDLTKATKEVLLDVIEHQKQALDNYETNNKNLVEQHAKEVKELTEFYTNHNKELSGLIQYYERKLKVLNDIINIETGGTKEC